MVLMAISAVQSGNQADILTAFEALAPLETGDVISELFLWVDDLTSGVAEDSLLQAAELPVPPRTTEMLKAVTDRDLGGLQAAVGSDQLEQVFASLLVLVAALRDARSRL
ncbi:hypothetical protein A6A22_20240 [Arthrobacter sp. OY3WO11]|nr:hypothetical protein A6A22_20240 [Arthrobacter sp. OY3WO11]